MPLNAGDDPRSVSIQSATIQCEILLDHLKGKDGGTVDPKFLRLHAVALLQLVEDLETFSRE